MKNLLLLLLIGPFTICQVTAQEKDITSKTAVAFRGYTVINPGEPIIIYKYKHLANSPKEANKYAPKYFFTTNSSDVLKELTKANLKKTFPTYHAFHDAMDDYFNEDPELLGYDHFHKMYKLNWILQSNRN